MNRFLTRIEKNLWPRAERRDIWMIVDAARDRAIFRMLLECRLEYSCLYSGFLPPALEIAAPYLVQLEFQDRQTRRLLEHAWGNSWGIFLKCDLRLDKLRRHLRQFLMVRNSAGGQMVFRYYDPRVLRVYLPTCNQEELETVFGSIECIWMEGQSAEEMLEFSLERGRLTQRAVPFDAEGALARGVPRNGASAEAAGRQPRLHGLLTIRQAQLAAFSRVESKRFEDWMLVHLQKFFPARSKSDGEAGVREHIRYGIQRAAANGITAERDVCKYIDLTMVFGRDFDTDKRFPWAREIARTTRSGGEKIAALRAAAHGSLSRG